MDTESLYAGIKLVIWKSMGSLLFILQLSGSAMFLNGTYAETDIQLRIKVKDQNDNAPIFPTIRPGVVPELSEVGKSIPTSSFHLIHHVHGTH